MARTQVDLNELTDQIMLDPAITEHEAVIARRPILDVYGYGIRFGGVERDKRHPERIVKVQLIRIGAPERTYTFKTNSTRMRDALFDALGQLSRRLGEGRQPLPVRGVHHQV